MFGILQGALWCKGYSPGHYYSEGIDGYSRVFDDKVERAIVELKKDMGYNSPNGIVTTNVIAALLSMDAFKLLTLYNGNPPIREFQQYMNRTYEANTGAMPCDGLFSRNTNKALLFAIQAEEGLPVSVANGSFGPTTKTCCPTIPYVGIEKNYSKQPYSTSSISQFTKLFKFGMFVIGDGNFEGALDTNVVKAFQRFHALPETGIADITTWLSTAISYGDQSRPCSACDTRFEIISQRLVILKQKGYKYVGRYLTGGDFKEIREGELQRIFDAGLSVFPIFQAKGTSSTAFSTTKAIENAQAAEVEATEKVFLKTLLFILR